MADDLKKLNKTVEEAVMIMKLYVGNSAQLKNMNEKQREAIEKWFDVADTIEKKEKQQRAFAERERDEKGRFLKKQEENANQFMGIAKSIGGLFMGMAKGIGKAISGVASGVTSHIKNFFGALKSHFLGLFGEESEWFDILGSIKDSLKGFFGWFIRGFIWIFKRTPKWATKLNKTLSKMFKLQLKQMKLDFLDLGAGKKKKTGVWKILGMILMGVLAGLGAWLHRKLIAFKMLPIWGKIGKMFRRISKIPGIGKMFKALKFGFKWLGWPLSIILGVIDFIKAYASTEGTIWEKTKAGLKAAIMGFLEFPIMVFKWLGEKILDFFGLKFDDIPRIFDEMWTKIKQKITDVFIFILNLQITLWNNILDLFINLADKIPDWMGGSSLVEMAESMKAEPVSRKSALDTYTDHQGKKLSDKNKQADDLKKSIDDSNETQKKSTVANQNNLTTIAKSQNVNAPTNQMSPEQIKDEIDEYVLSVKNYNGDFD
jgi:hypothetical protein